jgi:hypothetical protein
LLDRKVGDIPQAGMAKQPPGTGRFIAEGIAEIEAARGAAPVDATLPGKQSPPAPRPRAAE